MSPLSKRIKLFLYHYVNDIYHNDLEIIDVLISKQMCDFLINSKMAYARRSKNREKEYFKRVGEVLMYKNPKYFYSQNTSSISIALVAEKNKLVYTADLFVKKVENPKKILTFVRM